MQSRQLPPGSVGIGRAGETASFIADPIAFVWDRYRKYGPVFRTHILGSPRAFLIGPEANKLVLNDHADWFSVGKPIRNTRGAFYSDEALTLNDGESFRRLKSLIAPTFHARLLERSLPFIKTLVRKNLAAWADRGEISFWYEMSEFMHEVNSEWLTGRPLDAHEKKLLHDFFDVPEGRYTEWPPSRTRQEIRSEYMRKQGARDALYGHIRGLVRERKDNPGEDAIGTLCAATDKKTQSSLTEGELVNNIVQLLIGGYDTTASVSSWFFYRLSEHPAVREKLLAEIEEVVGDEEFSYAHLRRLDYLRCVLKEVERMHSPGLGALRMSLREFEFGGYRIPAGWRVQLSTYVTHFLPDVFENPESFDPDRFAPPREEDRRTPFSLIGFGGGLRLCPGKQFAILIMSVLAVEALRNYRWATVEGQDFTPVFDPMLKPKGRMQLDFARRDDARPAEVETGSVSA